MNYGFDDNKNKIEMYTKLEVDSQIAELETEIENLEDRIEAIGDLDEVSVTLTNSTTNLYFIGTSDTTTTNTTSFNRNASCYVNTGSIYATTGFYVTSSKEEKHDIEPLPDVGLKTVNSTNIVSFVYNNDSKNRKKVGFIAEEADKILLDSDGEKVDIYNCIGILFKAIQELYNMISQES